MELSRFIWIQHTSNFNTKSSSTKAPLDGIATRFKSAKENVKTPSIYFSLLGSKE